MARHQRKNASSNTAAGSEFELLTFAYFKRKIRKLIQPYWLEIGHIKTKKHKFDLGSLAEKTIIECKSHTWTESGNVPSAKLTVWDQAMLYFYLAPRSYRKLLVVKRDYCARRKCTLGEYYIANHAHVIPDEVEFWEADEATKKFIHLKVDLTSGFTGKP